METSNRSNTSLVSIPLQQRSVCETPRKANNAAPRAENRLKLKTVCDDMRLRIMSRAFYGWYKHYKQAKTLKKHLLKLIVQPEMIQNQKTESSQSSNDLLLLEYIREHKPLDLSLWSTLRSDRQFSRSVFYQLVYEVGIEDNELRKQVWPYLLDVFGLYMTNEEVESRKIEIKSTYERLVAEWQPIETYVREREAKILAESSITPIKLALEDEDDNDSGCHSDLTNATSSSSMSSLSTNTSGKFDRKKSMSVETPIRSNLSSSMTTRKSDNKGKITKQKGKIRWSSPIATRNVPLPDTSQDLDISSIIIKVNKLK